jgi:hypothetical protein
VAAKLGSFFLNLTTNGQARGETRIITALAGYSNLIKIETRLAGEAAMPNINRPSLKHETNFKTKDGDRWLPFTDDAQIQQMIDAFMVINSKVIWDKTILKNCNRAFCNLPGRRDFAAV